MTNRAQKQRPEDRADVMLAQAAAQMLRHMGWVEAADVIIRAMEAAIETKRVTYDFARLMDAAEQVSCSAFGDVMIEQM